MPAAAFAVFQVFVFKCSMKIIFFLNGAKLMPQMPQMPPARSITPGTKAEDFCKAAGVKHRLRLNG
jgi:hypothetical protein